MDRSFNTLLRELKAVSPDRAAYLVKRIEAILGYEPRVGVLGQTGAGKSSLCNTLFGAEIAKIHDVSACTRNPQEVFIQAGKAGLGITLIDCPGVGERQKRDEEYRQLYEKLFPEFDLVLWLVKADDRMLSIDEAFFKHVVSPNLQNKPLFIVLTQAEKISPMRNWNYEKHVPGAEQKQNLELKREELAGFFGVPVIRVIPVSAHEEYNLIHLVSQIVFALPKERKITFAKAVRKEVRSPEVKKQAEASFSEVVNETVSEIFISQVAEAVGRIVGRFLKALFASWW